MLDAHHNLGTLLAKMGRTNEAMIHLQKAVELKPNNAEAHNNLGILLAKMGQTDEAMAHLLKAVELNPNNAGRPQQPRHPLGTIGTK